MPLWTPKLPLVLTHSMWEGNGWAPPSSSWNSWRRCACLKPQSTWHGLRQQFLSDPVHAKDLQWAVVPPPSNVWPSPAERKAGAVHQPSIIHLPGLTGWGALAGSLEILQTTNKETSPSAETPGTSFFSNSRISCAATCSPLLLWNVFPPRLPPGIFGKASELSSQSKLSAVRKHLELGQSWRGTSNNFSKFGPGACNVGVAPLAEADHSPRSNDSTAQNVAVA